MRRVAVGGIYHESNTFFSRPTTLSSFAEKDLHFGPDLVGHWRDTASEMGGFLRGADEHGFEAVPTVMAWGMPSGTVTAEAFESLCEELTRRIENAGPLDGVLLSLHGAMVSERYADADGEMLRRVRNCLAADLPLVVTTDYHANLTPEMVRWPDAIVGYDTYPHIDQLERGLEAAGILQQMMTARMRPQMWLARRPLFPNILCQITSRGLMEGAIRRARDWEAHEGIVSMTVAAGFPYCDVPDAGFTVLAVARESVDTAREAAESVAEFVWGRRGELQKPLPRSKEAVEQACEHKQGLVILADVGDNLGAGTPGDGTELLSELIRQDARSAVVLLCDPEAIDCAVRAGVDTKIRLCVGGKTDSLHGAPVEVEGVVRTISDGVFRNAGPMRDGLVDDQGPTAVLDTGEILIVITQRRMPMWNLQQLRALGIEPRNQRIIVVKSAIAFRAAYEPIASRIIEVDTPGLAAADVKRFSYQRLKRPVFPLDAI